MAEHQFVDPNSGAAPQPGGQVVEGAEQAPEEFMRDMAKSPEENQEVADRQAEETQRNLEESAKQLSEQQEQGQTNEEAVIGQEQELEPAEPQSQAEAAAQKQYEEGDNLIASGGSGDVHAGNAGLPVENETGETDGGTTGAEDENDAGGEADVDEDAEDSDDGGEDGGGRRGGNPPNQNANKQAWVNYAKRQGVSEDEAQAMTKQELIDQYGRA